MRGDTRSSVTELARKSSQNDRERARGKKGLCPFRKGGGKNHHPGAPYQHDNSVHQELHDKARVV